MLTKKQYVLTLLVAVIIFFVALGCTAWYFSINGWEDNQQSLQNEPLSSELQEAQRREVTILPQTKIILKVKDKTTQKETKIALNPTSLLGFNENAIKEQFDDYTVEVFNEKEVRLSKEVASQPIENADHTYTLGVDGEDVCIKDKDPHARPIKIEYKVDHLSRYVYSLLLNEEIEITNQQKEALLLNAGTLQKILQDYVGE